MKQLLPYLYLLLLSSSITAQEFSQLVQYNLEQLANLKKSLNSKSPSATPLLIEKRKEYEKFLKKADKLLDLENPTVMDKTILPPTKDKHDYLSISRYWWPDSTKTDGLPWIRRDGITNPDTQTNAVDRKRLGTMIKSTETLALAYYFSDDKRYAKKGVALLETWFLEEQTKMNPHLKYAQSVPGNPEMRRSGILDGRGIPVKLLDAKMFLSNSKYWSPKKEKLMNTWLKDYFKWLQFSETGKKGAEQHNNHGSWYHYQTAALSFYFQDSLALKKSIERTKDLMVKQQDSIGAQTDELKRTRSFFYSCFNLDAITRTALIAEKAGMPFWEYTASGNEGITTAIDFLIANGIDKEWEYKLTKKGLESAYLVPVLKRSSTVFDKTKYKKLYDRMLQDMLAKEKRSSIEKKIISDYRFINQGVF